MPKTVSQVKKCLLCNSIDHGALYRGYPAKSIYRKELVKIAQEEQKKKLPIGMRREKKTLASPTSLGQLTKSQKKRRRRNEKKMSTQTQNSVLTQTTIEKKIKTAAQPNKKMVKTIDSDEKKT